MKKQIFFCRLEGRFSREFEKRNSQIFFMEKILGRNIFRREKVFRKNIFRREKFSGKFLLSKECEKYFCSLKNVEKMRGPSQIFFHSIERAAVCRRSFDRVESHYFERC